MSTIIWAWLAIWSAAEQCSTGLRAHRSVHVSQACLDAPLAPGCIPAP